MDIKLSTPTVGTQRRPFRNVSDEKSLLEDNEIAENLAFEKEGKIDQSRTLDFSPIGENRMG